MFSKIAAKMSDPTIDSSWTEHSAQVHVSMTATFEGAVSSGEFRKSVKTQFKAAVEEAMRLVAKELGITAAQIEVVPLVTDFASVDSADIDDEIDWPSSDGLEEIMDEKDPDLDEEFNSEHEEHEDDSDD